MHCGRTDGHNSGVFRRWMEICEGKHEYKVHVVHCRRNSCPWIHSIYIYITLYLKICISSENVSATIRCYRFFSFFYIYGLYILFFVWTVGLSDCRIIATAPKWPTLEERRHRARLVLMYKIVNGLVKIDTTDRLVQPSRLSRNMGQHSFQIPSCNTIIRQESFYPKTIRDWNALPTDTATARSLEFKTHLLD
jgi:hypothetical protein